MIWIGVLCGSYIWNSIIHNLFWSNLDFFRWIREAHGPDMTHTSDGAETPFCSLSDSAPLLHARLVWSSLTDDDSTSFLKISALRHLPIYQQVNKNFSGRPLTRTPLLLQLKFSFSQSLRGEEKKLIINRCGRKWLHTSIDDVQYLTMCIASSFDPLHLQHAKLSPIFLRHLL